MRTVGLWKGEPLFPLALRLGSCTHMELARASAIYPHFSSQYGEALAENEDNTMERRVKKDREIDFCWYCLTNWIPVLLKARIPNSAFEWATNSYPSILSKQSWIEFCHLQSEGLTADMLLASFKKWRSCYCFPQIKFTYVSEVVHSEGSLRSDGNYSHGALQPGSEHSFSKWGTNIQNAW